MKHKFFKTVSLLFLAFLTVTNGFAGDHNFDACGHEQHDSAELRAHAATRTYWRDHKATNSESWKRFKLSGWC
jgi:hypothetical protein